jgi:hypothetical protein
MRVARQIGQHRLGPGGRPLGIDDPLALAYRPEPGDEGEVVGERDLLAEEPQLPSVMDADEFFEEAPARRDASGRCMGITPSWSNDAPGSSCGGIRSLSRPSESAGRLEADGHERQVMAELRR